MRELHEATARTDSIDVVVMSSTLQALPLGTLEELIALGRALVVVVPDPGAARWAELPVPVLGLDADEASLSAAIGDALLGRRPVRERNFSAASVSGPTRSDSGPSNGAQSGAQATQPARSEVITVTSAEISDGRTAAVAVPLAYALSFAAPTVLLDVNSRGSAAEFYLPVDPARGLPQLGRYIDCSDRFRAGKPATKALNARVRSR